MENKQQQINCTVESCKYQNSKESKCTLSAINVAPTENNKTTKPDESMCASYKYEQ